MKKKIVMAIAVLGMAFAGQMNAQDECVRVLVDQTVNATVVHDGGRFFTCECCNPDGGCKVNACS